MKTLLIPTLALTLASLPAHAQKTAEPATPTPPPAVASPAAPAASPMLLRKVQFDDAALSEIITYLNAKLAEQKAEPLNVVVSAGLETTKVPSMLLQNVTATDVLNVVAKMIDLTLEPVPSDSGKVAAWMITKGRPFNTLRGVNAGLDNGGVGNEVDRQYTHRVPRTDSAPGLPPNPVLLPGARALPRQADAPVPLAEWLDPASLVPAPAQVSRVIGIGKIYDGLAGKDDYGREKKEAELVETLSMMIDEQGLTCKVRLYGGLHVIVLKGVPEAVALIEQTVAALKENAGLKIPAAPPAVKLF